MTSTGSTPEAPLTHSRIDVLDRGFVALADVMGDDRTAARCARTSFARADEERDPDQDARLTRYLVRNRHNTPLEFCQLRYYIKAPLFVARQILRHRTASINEISLRYVTPDPEFYIPSLERMVSRPEAVKQGSGATPCESPGGALRAIQRAYEVAAVEYRAALDCGLAPEVARVVLPLGTYTEFYWQNDLHNTIHFLRLRLDDHAQWETRQYAEAMHRLAREHFPTAVDAALGAECGE